MIRRYTLLGGAAALTMAALYALSQRTAPEVPAWVLVLTGTGLGCLAGWLASRQDGRDLARIRDLVGELSDRGVEKRVRLQRTDQIGDLGRALDGLADRFAKGEKKKRRRKDRLQTILDGMSEAVLVTDSHGRINLSNEVLTDLIGFDAKGKTATEALRHPDFRRAVEDANQGVSSVLEIELDHPDGGPRRVLRASVSPLRKEHGTVAVVHDVTDARLADQVRRDFVANAGHELRTPLTAIRGFAETLREGAIDDPDSARGFLDVILRHTHRLQALVDDLADLSRLEGEELEFDLQPIDAGPVLDGVIKGLEAQTKARGLKMTVADLQGAPSVLAEERALEQVLVNLVDNAIKYTPEGGEVRFEIAEEGDDAVISVANTGPGIPEKHLPRVFERFYRVDAGRSRELGGTGLGLSIVKHLVAKMGGQIAVEIGGGWTRFKLNLPRADSRKSDTGVSPG